MLTIPSGGYPLVGQALVEPVPNTDIVLHGIGSVQPVDKRLADIDAGKGPDLSTLPGNGTLSATDTDGLPNDFTGPDGVTFTGLSVDRLVQPLDRYRLEFVHAPSILDFVWGPSGPFSGLPDIHIAVNSFVDTVAGATRLVYVVGTPAIDEAKRVAVLDVTAMSQIPSGTTAARLASVLSTVGMASLKLRGLTFVGNPTLSTVPDSNKTAQQQAQQVAKAAAPVGMVDRIGQTLDKYGTILTVALAVAIVGGVAFGVYRVTRK